MKKNNNNFEKSQILAFSWNICWEGILGKSGFGDFSKLCTPNDLNPCTQNVINYIIRNADGVDFILLQEFCRRKEEKTKYTNYPWEFSKNYEFSIEQLRWEMADDDLRRWETLLDWLETNNYNAIVSNAKIEAMVTFYKKNLWNLQFANAGIVSTDDGRPLQTMVFEHDTGFLLGVINIHAGHGKNAIDFAKSIDKLFENRKSTNQIDRIIMLGDTNIGTRGGIKNTKNYISDMKIKLNAGHVVETHEANLIPTCCTNSKNNQHHRTFADIAFDSNHGNFDYLQVPSLKFPSSDHLPIKVQFNRSQTLIGGMREIYNSIWD